MTTLEAIQARHSVRSYRADPIPEDVKGRLNVEITACNREGGLHIQLVTEEPRAFDSGMARYGKFSGVRNYIALIGPKGDGLDEKLGWYGERLALLAQTLGLNTCWVALTFSKGAAKANSAVAAGEKLVCVLALGYGATQGVPHKSRPVDEVCRVTGTAPAWFAAGMEAALLAPTAVNQQKFLFTLDNGRVSAKSTGGFYSKVDLGIVKYHFQVGAGKENFTWVD